MTTLLPWAFSSTATFWPLDNEHSCQSRFAMRKLVGSFTQFCDARADARCAPGTGANSIGSRNRLLANELERTWALKPKHELNGWKSFEN
jgi:hypothetical protein